MKAQKRQTPRLSRRQRVAALLLTAIAACLLVLDVTGSSLSTAHSGAGGLLGSLYRGTDSVLGPVRRFVQGIPHAGSDQSRISALQHENAVLKRQLADEHADRSTARQLSRLRLAAASGDYRVLPARVLAISPAEGFDWTVTIDAGTSSGVRAGESVTDGYGLVGRVLRADADTSVVLLAVDPRSGVGARDLRTGQVGVATGRGTDGFRFRPLDPRANLKVGDQLDTGPSRASSFVPNLAIGTITAVRVAADGSTLALVRPTTTPTSLDLVGVVLVNRAAGSGSDPGRSALGRTPAAGGR